MAMRKQGDSAEFLAHKPVWAIVPFSMLRNTGGREQVLGKSEVLRFDLFGLKGLWASQELTAGYTGLMLKRKIQVYKLGTQP